MGPGSRPVSSRAPEASVASLSGTGGASSNGGLDLLDQSPSDTSYGETIATGAIVAGRGTFEPAGGWGGDHRDDVPIFLLSRQEPEMDLGQ
jgi:hypothetical protein